MPFTINISIIVIILGMGALIGGIRTEPWGGSIDIYAVTIGSVLLVLGSIMVVFDW
jgi:hypothetical protein